MSLKGGSPHRRLSALVRSRHALTEQPGESQGHHAALTTVTLKVMALTCILEA